MENRLEGALVSAKFLAGQENYSLKEEEILLQMCI
jgi:hypothetical protein